MCYKSSFKILLIYFVLIFSFLGCNQTPDKITASIIAPEPYNSDYHGLLPNGKWLPPLQITFDSSNVSPANIDLANKDIVSGIVISPEIPGKWRWSGEYNIYFEPDNEWDLGAEYTVKISPSVFNKEVAGNKSRVYKFKTHPLEINSQSSGITRAPKEQRTPRFYAELNFNCSIDVDDLKKHSSLTLDGNQKKYEITWDEKTKTAVILSEPVSIKATEQKFLFEAEGFAWVNSTDKYNNKNRISELVPPLDEFFTVKDVFSSMVRDSENSPQQIVTVEFSAETDTKKVEEALTITLLPKYITDDGTPTDNLPDNHRNIAPHRWTYEDVSKYPTAGQVLKFSAAANEDLPELLFPFIIDVDDADNRYILVTVKPGFISKDGFPLNKDFQRIISVPKYPNEVSIMSNGAILPINNKNIITLASRGVKEIKTEVGKVFDEQLQNVISMTYSGGLLNPDFKSYSVDESNFTSLAQDIHKINFTSYKDVNYSYIDLGKYTTKSGPGLYYISVNGGNDYVERLILVTDMAIILKNNADGSWAAFVMSIYSGKPVSEATIQVIGKNGQPVITGKTDKDGYFAFAGFKSLPRDKTPIALFASKNNDVSFIPLNNSSRRVNYSNFNVGGVYNSPATDGIKGYVFTDRGIYRPGDTVHISGIVKQSDWKELAGVPVEAVINAPGGSNALVKKFSLNHEGIFEIEFKTHVAIKTGYYSILLYSVDGNYRDNLIGSSNFRIDEFEADTMRVRAAINGKKVIGWQKPDKISGKAYAFNMFGTPADKRRVKWHINAVPSVMHFQQFADYSFTDPHNSPKGMADKPIVIDVPDSITDEKGEASVNFSLDSVNKGVYSVSLLAEVFEPESGSSITAYDQAMVSPQDVVIGYKSQGNLNFIYRNAQQKVNFIALNNEGSQITADDLKLRLLNVKNISVLVKDVSGRYTYQSVEKTELVNESPFTITSDGSDYTIPTDKAGEYIIEIVKNDDLLCKVPFFISGASNETGNIDKNAELTVRLDKTEYNHNEEIKINITAPYSGIGLITVEQDKVYAHKWFKADTATSVQSVKVPSNLKGNGYINVSFIRSYSSEEVFVNPHSYGVVPFYVNHDHRKINLSLSTPQKLSPGDELTVLYEADNDCKVIIYGVDEGILQAAGYKTPSPLDFFFEKKALTVGTYQTVDLILPDYRILMDSMAAGGGFSPEVSAKMAASNLNPFLRKTAVPISFWSGIKDVKKGEINKYVYKIPDSFNGSLKIIAVAASKNALGTNSSSIISQAEVVLIPNTPFAVAEGDVFDISLNISNLIENSHETEAINISLNVSDNLEIIGNKNHTVSLKKDSSDTVTFKLKATGKPGNAEITFKTENQKIKKAVSAYATLSVRPAAAFASTFNIGHFNSEKYQLTDGFRNMYDEYSKRTFTVSSNPLAVIRGIENYLESYPYICTEQLTSKVFPLIYLASESNGALISHKYAYEELKKIIEIIRPRQRDDGGFSLWPNRIGVSDYSSIYFLHMLTEAKNKGFAVPKDIIDNGINWLGLYASKEPQNIQEARLKAYAIYILARNGNIVTRYIDRLENYLESTHKDTYRHDIVSAYIGASYILMQEKDKGLMYIKSFKPEKDGFILYSDYDSNSLRNANYLYLVSMHAGELLPKYTNLIENIIKNISDGYYNTLSAASFIMALGAVGDFSPTDNNISVLVTDKNGNTNVVTFEKQNYASVEFDNNIKSITTEFSNKSQTGYFYCVAQEGFNKELPKETSNGLEIVKEYLNEKGDVINKAKIGDDVTVKIKVRAAKSDNFGLVVITDILPGGFEIERNSIVSNSLEYADIREDRAVFYVHNHGEISEITYKAKSVSSGEFTVPALYGESMYNSSIKANTEPSKFIITENNANNEEY